ncbi:MAG: CoA-transferase [Myxococcota bacterium]
MRSELTRADYCIIACAEVWRGDGEIMASPMGLMPKLGAQLAQATFEPDLLMTDGVATLEALLPDGRRVPEGQMPYRTVFDTLWWGKRHVMMGASQLDRYGNQNISCIGDWNRPKVQLLGVRGAPGNTMSHPTSYWVAHHSKRVFVPSVDMVSGVGYDRAAALGAPSARFHAVHRVVTHLGVFDFEGEDHTMRVRSLHPGVAWEQVCEATGFAIALPEGGRDAVPVTRDPTDDEIRLIRDVLDPDGRAHQQVTA